MKPSKKRQHTFINTHHKKDTVEEVPEKPKPPKKVLDHQQLKLIGLFVFVIGCLLAIPLSFGWRYLSVFSQTSNYSLTELVQLYQTARTQPIVQTDNRVNLLVLGVDDIENQRNNSQLTDTIMVVSYSLNQNTVSFFSIPRDLWLDAYKTKINAIYYYGEISDSITGAEFISDVIKEITDIEVHHVLVVRLEMLAELIDILGGVEIDVPTGFVDTQFPRSDVDLAVNDPDLLYETVSFESGLQTMNGETALKYIRSRHSLDLSQGTDLARGMRQQLLIQAIIKKITTKEVLLNPQITARLLGWFETHMQTSSFTLEQVLSIALQNQLSVPEFQTLSLPIEDQNSVGVLFHPPVEKYQQWVYEPVASDWSQLKSFVKENL